MTMSQAVTETHQTGPMSNGCGDSGELTIEPMDITTDKSTDGSPSKVSPESDLLAGQLSPTSARRRSTRASALKAQEKIKYDGVVPPTEAAGSENGLSDNAEDEDEGASVAKKRKLTGGNTLDQYSHTFYIKEDSVGDVCEVSEESEISSLHSGEIAALKAGYEKLIGKELSEEQSVERNNMIKRCEAELRLEEARLMLMKKINSSQMIAQQKATEAKKMTPNIALNNPGGAYKPPMALPKNGASAQRTNTSQKPNASPLGNLTQAQQAELLRLSNTNPQMVTQLLQLARNGKNPQLQTFVATLVAQQQQQQHQQQLKEQQQKEHQAKEALLKEQQNAQLNAAKNFAALTPQQRAANARQAFRLQADKQLTQNLNTPKAQPVELNFIPNPNQPDFCHLVALDLIVQRLLKDKMSTANVSEKPYECEECQTDFSPSWRAMGSPDDLHLYCERCVHETQKKKIQKDHTAYLRKAFNKVQIQEKEFEKQIAEGKLDAVMAAAAAQAQAAAAAHAAQSTPSTPSIPVKQNGTSSTPVQQKTSTPSASTSNSRTSSTPNSSAAQHAAKNKNNANNAALNMTQMQMALLLRNPMMANMMNGMTAATAANSANLNAAGVNAMASMMMYNPMMQMIMAAQATQQQQQQQQQQSRSNQQAAQPNVAAMLLGAAMTAQAQGGGAAGASAASLQTFANSLNQAALLSNPQLLRQFQERFAEVYKKNGKK